MKTPRIITPPDLLTALPLSFVKQHARIEYVDDDALITGWLMSAYKYAETYTNSVLLTTDLEIAFDRFPCGPIKFPTPINTAEITYADSNGNPQTFASENYFVDDRSAPGLIYLASGCSWPSTACQPNAVVVSYEAGDDELSANVTAAICLTVSHLNENREATTEGSLNEIPLGVKALLDLDCWGSYA